MRRPRNARNTLLAAGLALVAVAVVAYRFLGSRFDDPTKPVVLADVISPGAAAGYNLLLITLDTTRPDHLSCYGYDNLDTPAIDSLLEHGVRFDDAVVSTPLTLPSHASLLTGLYPPAIGVRDNGTYRLAAEYTTLAELLRDHGYDTAAFIAAFVLDKRFGLDQGFDVYDFKTSDKGRKGTETLLNERGANDVTDSAIRWFKQRATTAATPFFAWVHYYDPHDPYEPPTIDQEQFQTIQAYDAEIAFVDLHLKRLLNTIDELNVRDRTLIVLASDHGESLTEHDETYHRIFIYDATIQAALILSCPTLFDRAYRVDDRVVTLVDILPTTLDLLGIDRPADTDGRSLLTAHADPDRAVYIESYYPRERLGCSELVGLRRHADKYIHAPTPEYYDLRKDPKELRNRYEPDSPQLAILEQQLDELRRRWDRSGSALAGAATMTPQEEARLRSLGYVGTTDITDARSWPDPKDQIGVINQLYEVHSLISGGQYTEALALTRAIADQCEGYDYPIHMLATAHEKLDQIEQACRVLQEYADRYPSADILLRLARYQFRLRRYPQMEKTLQAAEILDPLRGSIPKLRGDRFFEEKRYAEAAEQYEKAIEMDGDRLGPEVRNRLYEAKRRLHESGDTGLAPIRR
ncbi:MAG: sulfatase-like hydrolase/transferase [Phycisphaerales bacterium]|nr:MAG: sulfatase-like hydrolase/transferase [Phycisphaerales bacterium]